MATIPYAHITQGPAVIRQAGPATVRRGVNPIFPICCLGLILFLIAATIVLSLIPVYLSARGNRAATEVVPFTVLYRINNGTLPLGALRFDNCFVIQQDQRNFAAAHKDVAPAVPYVLECDIVGNTSLTRRRRQSQEPEGNLISIFGYLLGVGRCRRGSCLVQRAERFIALLLARGTFFLSFAVADGTRSVFSITCISGRVEPAQPAPTNSSGSLNPSNSSSAINSTAVLANDIAILNYALVLEQLEFTFYTRFQNNFTAQAFVAAGFTNQTYSYFNLIASHESAHVRSLTAIITQLGGTPVTPCTYNFASVTDVHSYVPFARILENTGAMAYDGAANGLADTTLRETAATVATVEGRHASYLNSILNMTGFPAAFENATVPSVIIQAIQPYIVSCPFTLTAPTVPYIGSSVFSGIPTTNDPTTATYTSSAYINDLKVLNFFLIFEQLTAAFYNTYATNFTSADYTSNNLTDATSYVTLIHQFANAHVSYIINTTEQRGGFPVGPCTYNFTVSNVLDFVRLARTFENIGVSAYDGAINRLTDTDLIKAAATIATVTARFAAFLNRLLSDVPFPDAVDPTRTPQQVADDLAPYQTCSFTEQFPVILNPSSFVPNS